MSQEEYLLIYLIFSLSQFAYKIIQKQVLNKIALSRPRPDTRVLSSTCAVPYGTPHVHSWGGCDVPPYNGNIWALSHDRVTRVSIHKDLVHVFCWVHTVACNGLQWDYNRSTVVANHGLTS